MPMPMNNYDDTIEVVKKSLSSTVNSFIKQHGEAPVYEAMMEILEDAGFQLIEDNNNEGG